VGGDDGDGRGDHLTSEGHKLRAAHEDYCQFCKRKRKHLVGMGKRGRTVEGRTVRVEGWKGYTVGAEPETWRK